MRLALLLLGLSACSFDAARMGGGSPRSVAPSTVVEVAPATVGSVADLLVTNATVESERRADIIPQTSGIVREIRAAEGDAVQAGQILAVIDNISLDESASRAVAEVRRLEAEVDVSRRLVEQRAMAQRELDELEGRLLGARSTLREATVVAKQTRLVAPFEGVVGARDLRVGELVGSSTKAFQVVDLDALVIVASLPERDVARIDVGQFARAVSAYDPDLFADARVERVAPIIDAASGTFRVQLRLPPGQRALRPGQFVSVKIEVARHSDVVVVPKRALVYEDGMPVVYRMVSRAPTDEEREAAAPKPASPSGWSFSTGGSGPKAPAAAAPEPLSPFVAERVRVDIGLADDAWIEIRSGIAPGDQVVVLGQSALKDGARVRTQAASAGSADAPPPADGEAG
jgi:membrane fusion protein, multidrug efflux system